MVGMSMCSSRASPLAATILILLVSYSATAVEDILPANEREWEDRSHTHGPSRALLQGIQVGEQTLTGPEVPKTLAGGSQAGGTVASNQSPSQSPVSSGTYPAEGLNDIVGMMRSAPVPASTLTQPPTTGTMPQSGSGSGGNWAVASSAPIPQPGSGTQAAASQAAAIPLQKPVLPVTSQEVIKASTDVSTTGGLVAVHPASDQGTSPLQTLGRSPHSETPRAALPHEWEARPQEMPAVGTGNEGGNVQQMRPLPQDNNQGQPAAMVSLPSGATMGDPRGRPEDAGRMRRPENLGGEYPGQGLQGQGLQGTGPQGHGVLGQGLHGPGGGATQPGPGASASSAGAGWDAVPRDLPGAMPSQGPASLSGSAASGAHSWAAGVRAGAGPNDRLAGFARPDVGAREPESLPWPEHHHQQQHHYQQQLQHHQPRDEWPSSLTGGHGGGDRGGEGLLLSSSPSRDPSLAALQELFLKHTLAASQDPWATQGGGESGRPQGVPSLHPGPATSFSAGLGGLSSAGLDARQDQASLWHKLVHGGAPGGSASPGGASLRGGADAWGSPARDLPARSTFDAPFSRDSGGSSGSLFGPPSRSRFDDDGVSRSTRPLSSSSTFLSSSRSSDLHSSPSSRLNQGGLGPSGALPSVRDVASSGGDWRASAQRPDPVRSVAHAQHRPVDARADEEDAELAGPVRLAGHVPRRCELPFKAIPVSTRAGGRVGGRALLALRGTSSMSRANKPIGPVMRPLPLYNVNKFSPKAGVGNYAIDKPKPSEIRKAAEAAAAAAAASVITPQPTAWSKVTRAVKEASANRQSAQDPLENTWGRVLGVPSERSYPVRSGLLQGGGGRVGGRARMGAGVRPASSQGDYGGSGYGYNDVGQLDSAWGGRNPQMRGAAGNGFGGNSFGWNNFGGNSFGGNNLGGNSYGGNNLGGNIANSLGGAVSRGMLNPGFNNPNGWQPGVQPLQTPGVFPDLRGMAAEPRPGGIQQSFVDDQGRFRTVRVGMPTPVAAPSGVIPWPTEEPQARPEVRPVAVRSSPSPPPPQSPPPPPPESPPPPQPSPLHHAARPQSGPWSGAAAATTGADIIPLTEEELRRKEEGSNPTPADEPVPVFHAPTGSAYVAAIVRSLFRPVAGEACFEAAIACSKHGASFGMAGWHSSTRHAAGSCAVVGDRRDVLNFEMGNEIDAHTTVVRMGWHPTIGHERQIGTKTDLVVVNETMLEGHADGDKPTFKLVPGFLSTPRAVWVDARRMRDLPIMGRVSTKSSRFIQGKAYVTMEALVGGPTGADEMYEQLKQFVEENEELDVELVPSIYLEVITTLIGSQLCRTIDVYGLGNAVTGPYLSTTFEGHRREALATLENFILSVGMANGFLCVRS